MDIIRPSTKSSLAFIVTFFFFFFLISKVKVLKNNHKWTFPFVSKDSIDLVFPNKVNIRSLLSEIPLERRRVLVGVILKQKWWCNDSSKTFKREMYCRKSEQGCGGADLLAKGKGEHYMDRDPPCVSQFACFPVSHLESPWGRQIIPRSIARHKVRGLVSLANMHCQTTPCKHPEIPAIPRPTTTTKDQMYTWIPLDPFCLRPAGIYGRLRLLALKENVLFVKYIIIVRIVEKSYEWIYEWREKNPRMVLQLPWSKI